MVPTHVHVHAGRPEGQCIPSYTRYRTQDSAPMGVLARSESMISHVLNIATDPKYPKPPARPYNQNATHRQPLHTMRIRRTPRTPTILLIPKRIDHNRIIQRACNHQHQFIPSPPSSRLCLPQSCYLNSKGTHTCPRRVQRPHIKYINPLHLPQYLQSLKTSRLLQIRRHSARRGTWGEEIGFAFNLYQ